MSSLYIPTNLTYPSKRVSGLGFLQLIRDFCVTETCGSVINSLTLIFHLSYNTNNTIIYTNNFRSVFTLILTRCLDDTEVKISCVYAYYLYGCSHVSTCLSCSPVGTIIWLRCHIALVNCICVQFAILIFLANIPL